MFQGTVPVDITSRFTQSVLAQGFIDITGPLFRFTSPTVSTFGWTVHTDGSVAPTVAHDSADYALHFTFDSSTDAAGGANVITSDVLSSNGAYDSLPTFALGDLASFIQPGGTPKPISILGTSDVDPNSDAGGVVAAGGLHDQGTIHVTYLYSPSTATTPVGWPDTLFVVGAAVLAAACSLPRVRRSR